MPAYSKYTRESILETARTCEYLSEFAKNHRGAYLKACEWGMLDEIRTFLKLSKMGPAPIHSDAEIQASALKYETRQEWEKNEPEYFKSARHRGPGYMTECCQHMVKLSGLGRQGCYKYSDDEVRASAAKHEHKGQWKNADEALYNAARHRPALFLEATAHMTPDVNPYYTEGCYIVYAYEFADNYVYVGLTYRAERRKIEHTFSGPVFEYKKLTELTPIYRVLQEQITGPQNAAIAEVEWVEKYRADSWKMLNSAEAGGLGMVRAVKWCKEAVLAEALKFTTRQEWIDNSQISYKVAAKYGWRDEACAHMESGREGPVKWTKEAIIEDAKQYKTRIEWQRGSPSACTIAYRNGWADEVAEAAKLERGERTGRPVSAEHAHLGLTGKALANAKRKECYKNDSEYRSKCIARAAKRKGT